MVDYDGVMLLSHFDSKIQSPFLNCCAKTGSYVYLVVTSVTTTTQHVARNTAAYAHTVTHLAGWACL